MQVIQIKTKEFEDLLNRVYKLSKRLEKKIKNSADNFFL